MKTCRVCGKMKPLQAYPRHPTGADGRRTECLECRRIAWGEWYRTSGYVRKPKKGKK